MTIQTVANRKKQSERGAALVLALFALLLLSAIGFFMYMASGTEHNIDSNYGSSLGAYYAARSGLEEVRDRVKYPSTPNPAAGGLSDLLPSDLAGNRNGVLYILHPANGEVVDPTDITSKYFDDQLCHDYNSGAVPGLKCATVPTAAGWMATQPGLSPNSGSLTYKWVRVNMKTNRTMQPNYCVDSKPGAVCPAATADARVCWDGETEQLSPGGAAPACDANGMLSVYMLTSLAVSGNTRRLLRSEVVAPSIRPPGAITLEGASSSAVLSGGIPSISVDGRVHDINGNVVPPPADPTKAKCSNIASVATDTAPSTAQLEAALNTLRLNIVNLAAVSCNADGSSKSGFDCSPGLWWVRGTGSSPRFVTSTSGTGSSGGGDGGSSGGSDGGGSRSLTGSTCTSSTPNCYTGLDLGAPQLYAVPASSSSVATTTSFPPEPLTGGAGNQPDSTIYQSGSARMVQDAVAAVNALVSASKGQPNYFSVSSLTLPNPATFGSLPANAPPNPAIVVFGGTSVVLTSNLTGYGILVIPANFEIAAGVNFQWTGIVLIQADPTQNTNAQLTIDQGATGSVTGAVLLQAGSTVSLQATGSTSTANPLPSFRVSYSCDAVDMPFSTLPIKIISSTDFSY